MIAPARIAAYDALRTIAAGRADLPAAVVHARASLADDRDRALAADIASGVQRWRGALDWVIAAYARRPLDRLDPEIVDILRLSVYQLLHLTRVPASAVVDDAVNLAGKVGKTSARGFVNGVLRAISRSRNALPLPPRPSPDDARHTRSDELDYLAVTLSHPRWLAARWLERYGFDAVEQWLRFNTQPAPLTLRANRIKTTPEVLAQALAGDDVTLRPGAYAPDALIVDSGHPLQTSAYEDGMFVVQDEASQLVTLLAGAAPGRRVLDTCASPGGKATAIAATLEGDGRIVACDVRARRIELLRKTISTAGASSRVLVVQADVEHPLPFSHSFDCVIVDAPCSGLGTLRRDPDIKWRRQETDLAPLAAAQLRMLRSAAEQVARGGRLVYATCSSEPEENEDVASAFLGQTENFRAVDARTAHPRMPASVVDERGHLRTLPHRDGLEAFFGAVFAKL